MKSWTRSLTALLIIAVLLVVALLATRPLHHPHPPSARQPIPLSLFPDHFENGFVVPEWQLAGTRIALVSASGQEGQLLAMAQDTHSAWVEIPVVLDQPALKSPEIRTGPITLSLAQCGALIHTAHLHHLKVFLLPLVLINDQGYGGTVSYTSYREQQRWLLSLQKAWSPYLRLAQRTGVQQVSLASELEGMASAPAPLWSHYIQHSARLFKGPLMVDLNWSAIPLNPPQWMKSSQLWGLGIFSYFPLTSTPHSLPLTQIIQRDRADVIRPVARFSEEIHKPVILSQIGYRNQDNALYKPYAHYLPGKPDPKLQGQAYYAIASAALAARTHIHGVFFWGWNVGIFAPGPSAQTVWVQLAAARPRS